MNKKNKNSIILKIIIFSILILSALFTLRIFISSNDIQNNIIQNVKKEARVVTNYILASRKAYQEEFLRNCIVLDDKSLKFLPAHISKDISKEFLKIDKDGYFIRSVSDRPRNPENQADEEELKSISYFKIDTTKREYLEEYISNGEKYYQYSAPLLIVPLCLSCHGDKQNAPEIIQRNYSDAYGYKLGEVRGIISVKIPQKIYTKSINKFILKEVLFSIISMIIICFILYILYKKTSREIIKIDEAATKDAHTDALTNLCNRHYLRNFIDSFNSSDIPDCSFAIAFIDIDNFKEVNDTYGHEVGDDVLQSISKKLLDLTRPNDIVCRYGGEEFLIIMRKISQDIAYDKMEMIRDVVSTLVHQPIDNKVTISIGISIGTENDSIREIIREADKALYTAKNIGKNCVEIFQKKAKI